MVGWGVVGGCGGVVGCGGGVVRVWVVGGGGGVGWGWELAAHQRPQLASHIWLSGRPLAFQRPQLASLFSNLFV